MDYWRFCLNAWNAWNAWIKLHPGNFWLRCPDMQERTSQLGRVSGGSPKVLASWQFPWSTVVMTEFVRLSSLDERGAVVHSPRDLAVFAKQPKQNGFNFAPGLANRTRFKTFRAFSKLQPPSQRGKLSHTKKSVTSFRKCPALVKLRLR